MKKHPGTLLTLIGAIIAIAAVFGDLRLLYIGGIIYFVGQVWTAPTYIARKPQPLRKTGYPWPTQASRSLGYILLFTAFYVFVFLTADTDRSRIFSVVIIAGLLTSALIEAVRDYRWRGSRER